MRNLKLLDSTHCHQDQAQGTCCISVDCDTGQIYCATDKELLGLDPKTGEVIFLFFQVEDKLIAVLGNSIDQDYIVHLHTIYIHVLPICRQARLSKPCNPRSGASN